MAAVFDSVKAPSVTRVDDFLIDPTEVILKPEFNGRTVLPPIDDLLAGFMDVGQLQSCLIGRDGGVPILLAGHRRWRAALQLTKEKKGSFDGVFKLRCRYFKGTELEAFIATVSENSDRADTTPICDAHNIVKFQRFGLSDEEIAIRVYRKKTLAGEPDVKWVRDRAALIELTPEAEDAVKDGTVKTISAAVALAALSKTAQKDALKKARASGSKVTAASIKKSVAPVPASSNGHRKMTSGEIKDLIQATIDADITTRVKGMSIENAVRVVLGELLDAIR